MSEDEVEYTDYDLIGTSPSVILRLMIFVTLLVPLGYASPGFSSIILFWWYPAVGVYGLLWFLGYGWDFNRGLHFLQSSVIVPTLVLSIFNIFFVYQIWKYYQRKTTMRYVLKIGVVSLIFPPLLSLIPSVFIIPLFMIGIVWPIPIQFIIGLIILHKVPGPEVVPIVSP